LFKKELSVSGVSRSMTADTTTIELKKTTKAKLDKLGSKGDTYNDIIEALLK
jgi:hypothetical protein